MTPTTGRGCLDEHTSCPGTQRHARRAAQRHVVFPARGGLGRKKKPGRTLGRGRLRPSVWSLSADSPGAQGQRLARPTHAETCSVYSDIGFTRRKVGGVPQILAAGSRGETQIAPLRCNYARAGAAGRPVPSNRSHLAGASLGQAGCPLPTRATRAGVTARGISRSLQAGAPHHAPDNTVPA